MSVQTYFIGSATRIKIGKSHDPRKRLLSLQTASPERLTLLLILDGDREKEMHQRFAASRLSGEWFMRSPDVNAFVERSGAFYRWLILQCNRDEPIGDLANDAISDKNFPCASSDYLELRSYLRWHPHACREARITLARAYREWKRSMR